MSHLKRGGRCVALVALVAARLALVATAATRAHCGRQRRSRSRVLSDCQGAFGSFDNQDLAGVVTAMSQFAGG